MEPKKKEPKEALFFDLCNQYTLLTRVKNAVTINDLQVTAGTVRMSHLHDKSA